LAAGRRCSCRNNNAKLATQLRRRDGSGTGAPPARQVRIPIRRQRLRQTCWAGRGSLFGSLASRTLEFTHKVRLCAGFGSRRARHSGAACTQSHLTWPLVSGGGGGGGGGGGQWLSRLLAASFRRRGSHARGVWRKWRP